MINTIETKEQQLQNGYYQIGTGSETVLILGSCRAVPYITYLNDLNKSNRFTICFIDPMNWCWDMQGNRVNYEAKLKEQESNLYLLEMLGKVDIFIHEHYANAEMFNVSKHSNKNIHQFGLNHKMDIELPNFNDIFILTREIVSFDMSIRKMAIQDYNVIGKLSGCTLAEIENVRRKNLDKFYDICSKTSFPEFAEIFASQYKDVRYFWTFNHVSKMYTQTLFRMMNEKYLKLGEVSLSEKDLYANNYSYLSEYDKYYNWNEEIKPLKDLLY